MSAKTITRNSKWVGNILNQGQAHLNKVGFTLAESQQAEMVRLVQDNYQTVKRKMQLFIQAFPSLNHPVSNDRINTGKALPAAIMQTATSYLLVALAVALIADAAIGFLVKPSHEAG